MGLDIDLFINLIEMQSKDCDVFIHNIDCFDYNCTAFKKGKVYKAEKVELEIFSRSYSSWGVFRDFLASLSEVTCRQIWDTPDKFKDCPFFRLINFADNEGTICCNSCAELSKQFIEMEGKIPANVRGFEFETYQNLKEACKIASENNGCLVFR